ncbi:MAG: hypothetical protein KGZ60_08760 [Truepera sp.]|nr:hypothetical protein [Truepera sp.]
MERRAWLRGEVNGRDWLRDFLPPPQVWLQWPLHPASLPPQDQTALRYLEQRLDQLDYRNYQAKALP